jgi:hypothetical protein
MPVILGTWQGEIWRIIVPGQAGSRSMRPHLNRRKLAMLIQACFPSTVGSWPGQKSETLISKITRGKGWKHGSSDRVLVSKGKTLSSNSCTAKKKKAGGGGEGAFYSCWVYSVDYIRYILLCYSRCICFHNFLLLNLTIIERVLLKNLALLWKCSLKFINCCFTYFEAVLLGVCRSRTANFLFTGT